MNGKKDMQPISADAKFLEKELSASAEFLILAIKEDLSMSITSSDPETVLHIIASYLSTEEFAWEALKHIMESDSDEIVN